MPESKHGFFVVKVPKTSKHESDKPRVRSISSSLCITYQNVRGLNTKLKTFRHTILALESDIVGVTETWLSEAVEDSELVGGEWSVLRRDRAAGRQGGGVLLAARPGVALRRRPEFETSDGEDLWASCSIEQTTCHLCVVYIPPRATDDVYMRFFYKVESFIDSLNGVVLIIGDLNLNPKYSSVNVLSYYCYFSTVCNLEEMNDVVNLYGGTLDVVLVRGPTHRFKVCEVDGGGLVSHRDEYHPPLEFTLPLAESGHTPLLLEPSNVDSSRDWNFKKGDFALLYQLLSEVSWREVLDSHDVNTSVGLFYHLIYGVFDLCIPRKTRPKKPGRRYPVWFTSGIIKDIKRKAVLHRAWKRTGDNSVYLAFSSIRADIKARISQAYDDYIGQMQTKLMVNPRTFWQHIASLKAKGGFESQFTYEGNVCEGSRAAQAFADFFSSIFLPREPHLDHNRIIREDPTHSANYVHVNVISQRDVEIALKSLKPRSSPGPDNLPAYILKGCKEWLLSPLIHIFNLSLRTGEYPDQWKVTRVRPTPKVNNSSRVEDHRPIAILSSLAKLFESIINRLLTPQIQPFLSDSQHGFRSNRSVETNLLTLVDSISDHLDKGIQVDVLYFDFKKAFDRVDNDLLLSKLCKIGFSPQLLRFFASYLRGRQQYVQHGYFISDTYQTLSGVSQGSILGPLLFGIMVDDLASVLRSARCLLYADDLKLIYGVQEDSDRVSLQSDIDRVHEWSSGNRLAFNVTKCAVISFSRARNPLCYNYCLGTEPILRVNSIRDLGVILDTQLNFHEHLNALTRNCYKRLGFVIRNVRDFHDTRAIKLLYSALVRSKLEAASVVWNPYEVTYVLLLERVQKVFLRFLYKKSYGYYPFLYPTKFLLGVLGFNSLEVRRNFALLTITSRILRGESGCTELAAQLVRLYVPSLAKILFRPRGRVLLAVPTSRTVSRRNSPLVRALHLLNGLLASAPECDVFASRWGVLRDEYLRFSERMDVRVSSIYLYS